MLSSRQSRYLVLFAVLLSAVIGAAQNPSSGTSPATPDGSNSDKPLAAAARDGKSQKTQHAKKVFTDDDMDSMVGPLPALQMDGADKGNSVVSAISRYKAAHTAEETEAAVHGWYDRYDQMLIAAYKENSDIGSLFSVNMSNGNEFCQQSQDYEKCASRQMSEQRGLRSDQNRMIRNNALIMRIQQAFMNVRNGLMVENLHYPWFKIHTASGDEM